MGYSETSKHSTGIWNLKSSHTINDILLSQRSLHWFQGQSWLRNKHFKLWPIAVVINFYCSFLKSLILHPLVLIEKFLFDVIWEEQIPRRLFSGISKQLFCIVSELKCSILMFARAVNLSIADQMLFALNIPSETWDNQTSWWITDLFKLFRSKTAQSNYLKLLFSGWNTMWFRFKS